MNKKVEIVFLPGVWSSQGSETLVKWIKDNSIKVIGDYAWIVGSKLHNHVRD